MYYYEKVTNVSEQHCCALKDVASNLVLHIIWNVQQKEADSIVGNFASNVNYNAQQIAKVACCWCAKILQHLHVIRLGLGTKFKEKY